MYSALLIAVACFAVSAAAQNCASSQPSMERNTTVNGLMLHSVTTGRGPAVVLVHGFPATAREWESVTPYLSGCYTVIAVDLPGFGGSQRPLTGYDAFTLAQKIHDELHALGFDKIFLAGHDIGAPVAYAYAAQYPDEVRKLAVLELVLAGAGLEELVAKAGPLLWHFTFQSVPDLPEALVSGRERLYLSQFYRPFTANPAAFTDAEIEFYIAQYSLPGAMRAGFDFYRANPATGEKVRAQVRDRGKLKMPVLALAGDRSLGSPGLGDPVKSSVGAVAAKSDYEVVKECGHWIPEEQPKYLAGRLIEFFGK